MFAKELGRALRHLIAPAVAWAVAKGWVPDYMQRDLTEFFALVAALAIPYAWSWYRERTSKPAPLDLVK